MSVYCTDQSWELHDISDNVYRFISNSRQENDRWRKCLEQVLSIQRQRLEEKNEFEIAIDAEQTSEQLMKHFDPNAVYRLLIGDPCLVIKSIDQSVEIHYKTHLRRYGLTNHSQMHLSLGTKFMYGPGELFFSFFDDQTNDLVHKKINEKTDIIKSKTEAELLPEEKALVDGLTSTLKTTTTTPDLQNKPTKPLLVTPQPQPIYHDTESDTQTQSYMNIEPPSPTVSELKEKFSTLKLVNDSEQKIKPLPPAKPTRLKQPTTNAGYDTFPALAESQPISLKQKIVSTKISSNYDRLLNTPQKMLAFKRYKEETSNYEQFSYTEF